MDKIPTSHPDLHSHLLSVSIQGSQVAEPSFPSHTTTDPNIIINSLHASAECQIIQAPPVDHLYPLNHCPHGYKTQYILADCSLPLIHQPHNSYIQYTVAKQYLSLNPADIPITTLNPCFLVPKPTLHRSQTI